VEKAAPIGIRLLPRPEKCAGGLRVLAQRDHRGRGSARPRCAAIEAAIDCAGGRGDRQRAGETGQ
jgi:hypothetical protein